jgi:hypothetical protein
LKTTLAVSTTSFALSWLLLAAPGPSRADDLFLANYGNGSRDAAMIAFMNRAREMPGTPQSVQPLGTRNPSVSWIQYYDIWTCWNWASGGNNLPEIYSTKYGPRITAWRPGWQEMDLVLSDCCATQGAAYDFSMVDKLVASNRAWASPYGSAWEARLNTPFGSTNLFHYWTNNFTIYTNYDQYLPRWIARLSTGQQVTVYSQILSNFIVHESGRLNALSIFPEYDPFTGPGRLNIEVTLLSNLYPVARSNGVKLIGFEFNEPFDVYMTGTWSVVTNYCDYSGFHLYMHYALPPDGMCDGDNYLRYDQVFDNIASLGKPITVDEFGLFNSSVVATNQILADRTAKLILMLRKDNAILINPSFYYVDAAIPIASLNGYPESGGYSNGVLTAAARAIVNLETLIGNNACSTSSVQWPYYYYRFGTNAFAWLAEGSATTGMVLSGWSSPGPTYVRDLSTAPATTLGTSPIVLSGYGTIRLVPTNQPTPDAFSLTSPTSLSGAPRRVAPPLPHGSSP